MVEIRKNATRIAGRLFNCVPQVGAHLAADLACSKVVTTRVNTRRPRRRLYFGRESAKVKQSLQLTGTTFPRTKSFRAAAAALWLLLRRH